MCACGPPLQGLGGKVVAFFCSDSLLELVFSFLSSSPLKVCKGLMHQ